MSDEHENPFSDGNQSPGVPGAQIPGVHNMLDKFFAEEDMIDDVISQAAVIMKATIDGNGYKISAYPRIPNPMGADTGMSLCPRARARVQL